MHCCLYSQQDSLRIDMKSVTLEKVTLLSDLPQTNPLQNTLIWNANNVANSTSVNITDLFFQSTAINVKSYGSGGLATISIRGTGSGRSSTTWNGVPLIGSTLGLLDYSLLNPGLFESLRLSVGGDAGKYGTGSIGGNVALNNQNNFGSTDNQKLKAKSVLGSFGRFHQDVRYSFKKGKWWGATRASVERGIENFTYRIREDLPEIVNTNAARKQLSYLQSVGYRLNQKNDITLHLWLQDNARQIPPTTVQNRSDAKVEDKTVRLQGIWDHYAKDGLRVKTTAMASHNRNVFVDSLNFVFGDNAFQQLYVKTEAQQRFKNGVLNAGFSNRYTASDSENFLLTQTQNQLAFFADYSLILGDVDFYVSLREELLDNTLNPLSGKIGLKYSPGKFWTIEGAVNKHFRAPALNDLYWAPGGNEELQTERGWSQNIGIDFSKDRQWSFGVDVFNHQIENWIQWGLLEGSNFFSALNLPQVWSRGISASGNWTKEMDNSKLGIGVSYTYNLSTYQFDLRSPAIETGDQSYYSPVHQAVANIEFSRASFAIQYTHRLQSGVDTILDPLDGFHLGKLHLQSNLKSIKIFLDINNIWNAQYRVIERRPMPGRNFSVGINYNIL